jgi:hypothetical protein
MWEMGIAFKAPPARNVKQWRKVELLIRNGFYFHPNQFGWGRSPKTLRDAAALVKKKREEREPETVLKKAGVDEKNRAEK